MSPGTLWAVVFGLAAIATTASAQAPARDVSVAAAGAGTAMLAGRILDAGSGEPVHNVRVRAVDSVVLPKGRTVISDGDGRFVLKGLPAGHYVLSAAKTAYLTVAYGQPTLRDQGTPIAVGEGQVLDRLVLSIPHAGVVAGRITDESGDPLGRVSVDVLRRRYRDDGQVIWQSVATRSTNDLGEFRIFGLAPGRYGVSAKPPTHFRDQNDAAPRSFVPTYFPGTTRAADAQVVAVGVGQVVSHLNFVLMAQRGVRVSGTAFGADGNPLQGGLRIHGATDDTHATIGSDGTFSVESLPPGDYVFAAADKDLSTNPSVREHAAARVAVSGAGDISDVAIVGIRQVSIAGRIVIDPSATPAAIKPSAFDLMIEGTRPGMAIGRRVKASDDGTFRFDDFPGHFTIALSNTQPGWIVKQVRLDGQDITASGVEITGAGLTRGLEVEVTNVTSEIVGHVRDATGMPTERAWVIVFARNRDRPNAAGTRPDGSGGYRVRTLPPGSYLAVAVSSDAIEQGDWQDPEFLDRLRVHATPIDAAPGKSQTLDLKLTTVEP